MKEPSLCRRRKPSPSTKIKLSCSFNGGFQRPPPSGKPRYVGGETRILAVDRTIGFLSLRTKISELCPAKPVFALKYLLPESDDAFLVSIASDDDVRCMIEEFDRLKLYGNPSRLWIFACNGEDASFKRFEFEGFDANVGGFCGNTGVYGRKRVNGLDVKFCGNGKASPRVRSVSKESKNMVTCVAGVQRHGDEELSPREMILKLQLLAKKSQQTQSSCSSDIIGNNTELKCENESPKNEDASDDLASELQVSGRHEVTREGLEDLFGANMLKFHKNMDTPHLQGSRTLGRLVQVLVPHSNYLNLRGGNLCVGSNCSAQNVSACLDQMFGNDAGVNGGQNTMPCSHNCDLLRNPLASFSYSSHLAGSTYPQRSVCMCDGVKDSLQLSICNHELCVNDQKNQRNTSYNIQNHQNILTPIGNNQTIGLDRRPNLGKCHSGLGPNLKISKTGFSMKSHHPDSLKEMYCAHNQRMEGKVVDSTRKGQEVSFFNIRCCKENLPEPVVGPALPKFGEHQSPSSPCTHENSSCCLGAMETQGDLLANFQHDGHEDLCQPACENLHGVPINCAIQKETSLINLQGADAIFCHANYSVSSNGTEVTSSGKLLDMRTSTKEEMAYHKALQCDKASSVDISFWDLSSLCKEEEPLALSAASSAGSERLLKPQPQILDLIDEKGVCLGPKEERSNGVTANYSSQTAAQNHLQEESQQDSLSNISINKKAETNGSPKYSEIIDKTPSELAAFYSYLVSRELQTIKYSDLEYIKELGTGTYGTVFYGKWRGSDVAIKSIKPSCFTGGAMEEDRLVADFWKEAHILGQLHHPNIVTLYGVVRDGPVKDFAAVTEYMVNGSLKQVLQRKDRIIDRRKRLIIAMDAAFGMEYLHEKNIVHFDLKSHNFLVNIKDPQRPVCKICDLGLSKVKQNALVSGGVRGTLPWMAPELLSSKTSMVTEKVDVYSFGIVMWELLAGEEPYGNMRSEEIMAGIMKGNLRPEVPSWCDPAWRSLMERCWSSVPESRPSFSEIAKELRAVSADINIR